VRSESHALRLRSADLVVSIEFAVEVCCCCVTFHCIQLAVKQRLNWNTGNVFNCLNQFFLTMVLSIEELVFLVEYFFRESIRYTNLV
jgi:hypothetical protein